MGTSLRTRKRAKPQWFSRTTHFRAYPSAAMMEAALCRNCGSVIERPDSGDLWRHLITKDPVCRGT